MSTRKLMPVLLLAAVASILAITTPAQADSINLGVHIGVRPPPPRVEVIPAARPGYVWVPGHWRWRDGAYIWVRAHWRVARPGFRWVPAHWRPCGPDWCFVRGHWAR